MTSEIMAALIGAAVPTIIAIVAYLQWKNDFSLKIRHLSEAVTAELIGQRIGPYTEFMKQLRVASTHHDTVTDISAEALDQLFNSLQDAVYGSIGLLSSHETRQLILHCRGGCLLYRQGKVNYDDLILRIWALHLSLRSDLGIHQPEWESAVEKIQNNNRTDTFTEWEELVRFYPWERILDAQQRQTR